MKYLANMGWVPIGGGTLLSYEARFRTEKDAMEFAAIKETARLRWDKEHQVG